MKKWLCCLLIICLLPLTAVAFDSVEEVVRAAKSALTEVYGYEPEETEAFDFRVMEFSDQWYVEFAPKGSVGQEYTARFDKESGTFIDGSTPYFSNDRDSHHYAGESAVRAILRAAEENGWFKAWDDDAKAAFLKEVKANTTEIRGDLAVADKIDGYSAARAINDLFLSCYGSRGAWSPALTAWRDAELQKYGFTTADCAPPVNTERGVRESTVVNPFNQYAYDLTEFIGEAPESLARVLAHPKLAGYEVLSGVLVACPDMASGIIRDCGLIAFGKGEERMLVLIYRPKDASEYLLFPVGAQALMRGREVVLSFGMSGGHAFSINYPVSDTALERFTLSPRFTGASGTQQLMCELIRYERYDYADDSGVLIEYKDGWRNMTAYTADDAGTTSFPMDVCPYMEYIDADAMPKSLSECFKSSGVNGISLPEGFTAVSGANLREKTSSRSRSLGKFLPGTLARALYTVPGDPVPWLYVQIGDLSGYMSANYAKENSTEHLFIYPPLRVARVDTACELKGQASDKSETVTALKAGYKMHVLATLDDWYYVCVPSGEPGWMMDVNGASGYVRQKDVTIAATALHLDWTE